MTQNDTSATAKKDALTRKERKFVAAMLTSRTVEQAATAAGISRRTAYRYLEKVSVRVALGHALDAVLSHVSAATAAAMAGALDTLIAIHENEKAGDGARVTAAKAVMELGPKLRIAQDWAVRLAAAEDALRRTYGDWF